MYRGDMRGRFKRGHFRGDCFGSEGAEHHVMQTGSLPRALLLRWVNRIIARARTRRQCEPGRRSVVVLYAERPQRRPALRRRTELRRPPDVERKRREPRRVRMYGTV